MFTLLQNLALCVPKIRHALGIPKLLKPPAHSVETSSFIENFRKALNNFQTKKANEIIIHSSKPAKLLK